MMGIDRRNRQRTAGPGLVLAAALALLTAAAHAKAHPAYGPLQFNRDIRPILSNNCFLCHGTDPEARMAGLRLDTPAAFQKLADGRIAIVPGKPDASELIQRITAKPADRMPPAYSNKHLTAAEIETLRRWIAQGAPYQPHWAYIKPVRAGVPAVKNTWWPRNAIDRFVLARLEQEGLKPSPTADRRILIRRLSLDLTGLPPTMDAVTAFLNDHRPDAYTRLVDRLLASPQFGERMAQDWLDMVRYADTDGYHGDRHRDVYPFRDWVVQAFNQNMSFDQFTIDQLAGDLLPHPTLGERIAAGYNRLNMVTREGGAQPKEYLAKYAAERVRDASEVWLGSTMGCSECHDHKFDPFTSKDFYSFEAFFADIQQVGVYSNDGPVEPEMEVPSAEQTAALAKLNDRITALNKTLTTSTPELIQAEKTWETSLHVTRWTPLHPASTVSAGGATLTVQPDDSVLASGKNPETDTVQITVPAAISGITAFRLEALPDDSLPQHGPGRAVNGNFVLTHFSVTSAAPGGKAAPVPLQDATATHEQTSGAEGRPGGKWAISAAIDPGKKDAAYGWAILDETGKPNAAVFEVAPGTVIPAGATLTFSLDYQFGQGHSIGHFRLAATSDPLPVTAGDGVPPDVRQALALPAAQRSPTQLAAIDSYFRSVAPELAPVRKELKEVQDERADVDRAVPRMLETVSVKPAVIHLLPRGNWMDESGPVMSPAVPEFLPPMPAGAPANRLGLARWIVSRDNPLTARVFVNRLWDMLFGAGIVSTPGDFGTQGSPPSHPKLLDWLAVEFMDSGWNVKHMIRLMVLSNTYRQVSTPTPALLQRDPYNRLLARQGRFRVEAETVRDNALAICGTLSLKMGGRSVFPYQPDHYWDNCNTFAGKLVYNQDHGQDLYRRGLYTYWKRSFLNPRLLAFDAPTREECTVERSRSDTPLQALVLLNDPTFVEAARVFAAGILRDGGATDASRIDWAFQRALARHAAPREIAVLSALQQKSLQEFRSNPADAKQLLSVGEWPAPSNLDPVTLASWTTVARVIFNLHETITRE